MYSIEEIYDNEDLDRFISKHPGNRNFVCEYCGVYTAGKAFCNKCEEDEPLTITEQEMMRSSNARIAQHFS